MSDNLTKKPEKLASAIYLISSFFNDQEPLKWKLRSLASELVSFSVYFKDSFFSERKQAGVEIRNIVLEVVSLLSVAQNAGLVSEMNHGIIHKELLNFLDAVGLPVGLESDRGGAVLSSNFFGTRDEEAQLEAPREDFDIKDKTPEPEPEPDFPKRQSISERTLAHTDKQLPKKPSEPKDEKYKQFGAVSVKKSTRQNIIISLLKRKKEIMIKDVAPLISGCSEKTIQRELLAMVEAGILKKTGEKRWSRYSLARP